MSEAQQPGTEVVDQAALTEALRKRTEEMKAKIGAPGGDKIKLLKSKEFVLPSGVKSKGPLLVVVIDAVSFNAFYDRPFSEKDKTPPACFALGAVKPKDLVPSANSPDKQSDACKGCPNNEFGSRGNGKACGNHYLLGCVEPSADANTPLYLLQLSPKGTRHWEAYANGIMMQESVPPIGVVTEIYFDPNEDSQVLRFNKGSKNVNLAVHMARGDAVLRRLLAEPDVSGYTKPAAPAPRKK